MVLQPNAELKDSSFFILFRTKKKNLYPVIRYKKSVPMPTIFLFLFSHPQEHTNPTTLMDAKEWALTIF